MSARLRRGPQGLHVYCRSTGLNLLFDEFRPDPSSWARAPRQVAIALTNACDLACSFCYAPKAPARLNPGSVKVWLSELDSAGAFGIGFGGGEPTLHPSFVDLCRFGAHETGLAVTFTTHGHHLTSELCRQLTGLVHFTRISVDGIGTTYERIRGRQFSMLLTAISRLRDISPFGINCVINDLTISQLDDLADLAGRVGAREIALLPEQPSRRAPGIDESTAARLRSWVTRYQGSIALLVSEEGHEGLPVCADPAGEVALRAYSHIDASGIVRRSSFDAMGEPIADDGLLAALNRLARKTQD